MIKIIFVLVINAYQGGLTTIDFTTLQQCETAREKVQEAAAMGARIGAVCIEKKVPLKRTKCKVSNEFSRAGTGHYYPVSLECVEE
jgi:hypothetical protein